MVADRPSPARKRTPLKKKRSSATPKARVKKQEILGKRKGEKSAASSTDIMKEPEIRSSKRARMTAIPYQAPESISTVLQAMSNAMQFRSTADNLSVQKSKTPKKSVTRDVANLKKPTKTIKKVAKIRVQSTKKAIQTLKSSKNKVLSLDSNKSAKAKKSLILPLKKNSKKTPELQNASKKSTIKVNKKIKIEKVAVIVNKKRISKKEALEPKPNITLYEKDPTFFSKLPIPHISTLAHSRLLIRAVLLNDNKLLRQLVTQDISQISSLCTPRSPEILDNAYTYAIKSGNQEALKIFLSEVTPTHLKKIGDSPDLLIESESTGYNSRMMFGHGMRSVTVGRGGKEGNAALLKDSNMYSGHSISPGITDNTAIIAALENGVSYSTLTFMSTLVKDYEHYFWSNVLSHITFAMRHGHFEIAGSLVNLAIKRGGYGFNHLHEQSLTHKSEPFSDFKSVSVVKKSTDNFKITPLHCAAINPNPYYLKTLLLSRPEYNTLDQSNWLPIHYAAVCSGDGPLNLLLSHGVASNAPEKTAGDTPLHLAVSRGRLHNVKLLIEHDKKNEETNPATSTEDDDDDTKKLKKGHSEGSSLDKLNRHGMTPLHLAAKFGHTAIVKYLLKAGANADKFCSAQYDKLTPVMIACQYGHLDVVKVLVDHGVKLALEDRRGRTTIFHATMNGHAHVLSYLLRLGVNQHVTDSSGNTLAQYAAAYGWYFNLKLLLEAGCDVAKTNDWKLSPLGIAWMKGHVGIVELLVKQPGVDINTPVDAETGKSLLMVACTSSNLEHSLIPRLKFLVDELKADSNTVDYKKDNALHHLSRHTIPEENSSSKNQHGKHQIEAAKFLIDRSCDATAVNLEHKSPFMIACEIGNFRLAEKFIEWGVSLKLDIDLETGDTLLHKIAKNASKEDAKLVYEKLVKDQAALLVMKEMAKIANKEGATPLLQTLSQLSSVDNESANRICNFTSFLVTKLDADVNAVLKNTKSTSSSSALHFIVKAKCAISLFKILQTKNLNLDPLDDNLRTPLATAILNGISSLDIASALIMAGANANFKSEKDFGLNMLLLLGDKQPTMFSLIPQMITKGVNIREANSKNGNSILHYIARNPKQAFSLDALKAVISAGADVNIINKSGRTPLHLVVNSRANETDVAYDIEDFLLLSGADLSIKDIRGRMPLHYAFVKIGKPLEKSFLDPIELVMILLNSLKAPNKPVTFIKMADIFGSTPLHYAAMRGATICCSYFTSEIQGNIDIKDMRGNTPFGLAVWCGHEGCSLHFQQYGANFLHILDTNIQMECDNSSDQSENNIDNLANDEESDTQSQNGGLFGLSIRPPMWKKLATRQIFGQSSSNRVQNDNLINSKSKLTVLMWDHVKLQKEELNTKKIAEMKYPIFHEVVKKEWQGILHLMLGKLRSTGANLAVGISTAIKMQKMRLALKLIHRVKDTDELEQSNETLLHTLAKYSKSGDADSTIHSEVIKGLLEKGVNPLQLDSFNANPVIYAAMNFNLNMIKDLTNLKSQSKHDIARMPQDHLGRTPFSALFWNLNEITTEFSLDVTNWAFSLLSSGASPNLLSKYPIILSPYPVVRCLVKYNSNFNEFPQYSPLIVAVILQKYAIVAWLLKNKSVDLNFKDDEGRTAMMHAVRLNDLKMVKQLLNPTYKPVLDNTPWKSDYTKWAKGKLSISPLDINIKDNKGWTALDYIVCPSIEYNKGNDYSYSNVEQILTILHNTGGSFTNKSGDGLSPLDRALKYNRFHIVKVMYKISNTPFISQMPCRPDYINASVSTAFPIGLGQTIDNFPNDAKLVAEEKLSKIQIQTTVFPDPLLQLDEDNSVVVMDNENNIPFDCILTQVDVDYGMAGLYNFYKMQVVKQPRGKELVLLFTQWGRVGTQGQHQKTPFPSEDDAIKEFKKIFKAKSGNNWENIENFQPFPKKYRLVHKELRKIKTPWELKVDFDKICSKAKINRSVLPFSVYYLIEQLTLAHKMIIGEEDDDYYHRNKMKIKLSNKMPIISPDSLRKAESILDQIHALIVRKSKMRFTNAQNNPEEDKMNVLNELVGLSEEYYALVPVYGFATESLQPIFDFRQLRDRQEEIYKLIHLGFGKELLLAAEYNSEQHNPFEYIYRCLGVKLNPLNMKNDVENVEAQLLLQYIHNTAANVNVHNIFKVQRSGETELTVDNRWLLFHGSKPENILSILHNGLQVCPLGVAKMGDLFGKGIYFADAFSKSQGYSDNYASNVSSKFIFLCEVALGKVQEVQLDNNPAADDPSAEVALSKVFNSSKTSDAKEIPDPGATILRHGVHIPLGTMVDQYFPDDQSYGLNYNEYIIFNEDQVRLRYLIQFSD